MIEYALGTPALDLAVPHRPVGAEPDVVDFLPLVARTTPRSSTAASTSRRRRLADRLHLAAGDRSARAEEHGALGRGRRATSSTSSGSTSSRPLSDAGVPLRPVEDPLGVIDAYRLVREQRPEVQLALVGSMAHDDPEGWEFYNQTVAYAGRRPGHLHPLEPEQRRLGRGERLPGELGRSDPEVDPRGVRSDGVRGALEGTPGRGRPGRRHRDQIADGETGFLVASSRECAEALPRDPRRSGPGAAMALIGQGARPEAAS